MAFAQHFESERPGPDIASRLRLQDCKCERPRIKSGRLRRRAARAPWMARVFRDDEQNQSFPSETGFPDTRACVRAPTGNATRPSASFPRGARLARVAKSAGRDRAVAQAA